MTRGPWARDWTSQADGRIRSWSQRAERFRWCRAFSLYLGSFPRRHSCSPAFEPTIRALGPEQVVLLGTIGERVRGGREFHVRRWFNGDPPAATVVIAFKEGAPVGDCSYWVTPGADLVIAPYREADGRLSADLGTLQADPSTEAGRAYLAEATALFGPGRALQSTAEHESSVAGASRTTAVAWFGVGVMILLAVLPGEGPRRKQSATTQAPPPWSAGRRMTKLGKCRGSGPCPDPGDSREMTDERNEAA